MGDILILAALLGVIPALIARQRALPSSFLAWWLFGAALFIVALPVSLLAKPKQADVDARAMASGDMRKCPHCAELVRREAKVCRYCQRELEPVVERARTATEQEAKAVAAGFCPHCRKRVGAPAPDDCPNCGRPIPRARFQI